MCKLFLHPINTRHYSQSLLNSFLSLFVAAAWQNHGRKGRNSTWTISFKSYYQDRTTKNYSILVVCKTNLVIWSNYQTLLKICQNNLASYISAYERGPWYCISKYPTLHEWNMEISFEGSIVIWETIHCEDAAWVVYGFKWHYCQRNIMFIVHKLRSSIVTSLKVLEGD